MELKNNDQIIPLRGIRLIQVLMLSSLFLTSCSSLGENFFIRNYEDESVKIKYAYHEGNIDSAGFIFQPTNFILISDTLLSKKVLRQFPYKSHLYFDSVKVKEIDSLTYELEMPAKSTIRIAPIYYFENIKSIIINNADTISFVSDYPHVENVEFMEEDIIKHKYRIIGDSYYILNINLNEIHRILHD